MGLLDDVLEDDARFAFTDTDVFGETVTYKPAAGSNRSIKAVVHRNLPPIDDNGVIRYPVVIEVENNSTRGISSTELDSGADKISVAYRHGGTAQDTKLGVPEAQDAGMLVFRVYLSSR